MTKGKEIATVEEKSTALTTAQDNNMMSMFAEDAGEGLENIGREDTKIPFLRVLQPLSPEVDPENARYVEGARAGMILNTVTRDLYDGKEGVIVIPVHFEKTYIEWRPRTSGGGFVNQYTTREAARSHVAEGNDIVDTANHYCLVQTVDNNWTPAVLSCKSTMMSASRAWNAMMQAVQLNGPKGPFNPPSYACMYSITTARQQNDKGTWYNISVERVGLVQDPALYAAAKAFRKVLIAGEARVSYDEDVAGVAAADVVDESLPSF